jgi:hypothetical protein
MRHEQLALRRIALEQPTSKFKSRSWSGWSHGHVL